MKNHEKALARELDYRKMLATLYLNQGSEFAELRRHSDYAAANEKALKVSRESGLVPLEATKGTYRIQNRRGHGFPRCSNFWHFSVTG